MSEAFIEKLNREKTACKMALIKN